MIAPHWSDDRDELLAFAWWYFGDMHPEAAASEVLRLFEKPWDFDEEYAEWKGTL